MPEARSRTRLAWYLFLLAGIALAISFAALHRLGAGRIPLPSERSSPVVVEVNLTKIRPISPRIFGINGSAWLEKVPPNTFTLIRLGGNRYSTYNYQTNDSNAGADFHHQNDDYLSNSHESLAPIRAAIATGIPNVVVTVPMLDWVAADRLADGDVRQTPNYRRTRFRRSLASCTTEDNAGLLCQDQFVRDALGLRTNGQPHIDFELDNEPEGWHLTHARLRGVEGDDEPAKLTYAELFSRSERYAQAIRNVDSRARIFGPVGFGFPAFIDLAGAPDANGRLFLDAYVAYMRRRNLLDVLDVHWYPMVAVDGQEVASGNADPAIADVRVQLPRSLYDPNYQEPSWIARDYFHGAVQLLPWLAARAGEDHKVAITEYHYGGGNDISGAVAIADALGAFGYFGVDSAAVWPLTNQEHDFTLAAFRVLRDQHPFQGFAIDARSSDNEKVGAWAALDGELMHVVLIVRDGRGGSVSVQIPQATRLLSALAIDAEHRTPFDTSAQLTLDGTRSEMSFARTARGVVHIVLQQTARHVERARFDHKFAELHPTS